MCIFPSRGGPAGPAQGPPTRGSWEGVLARGPILGGSRTGGPPTPRPPHFGFYFFFCRAQKGLPGPFWGSGGGPGREGPFWGVRRGGPWEGLSGGRFWGVPDGGRPGTRPARPPPPPPPGRRARPGGRGAGRGWWRRRGGPGPVRPPPDPRSTQGGRGTRPPRGDAKPGRRSESGDRHSGRRRPPARTGLPAGRRPDRSEGFDLLEQGDQGVSATDRRPEVPP